ncbi:hypothetical protein JCM10908_006195 [Rhodotorula pacifica]|uniref:F-box protein n=1 Tax=Rhodotorula pacifica TaxID=1495444 RepID=UPI00317A5A57
MHKHSPIFSLPPEILTHCLCFSTPEACAAFAQTCKAAYTHCQSTALWRGLHRAIWDDPQPAYSTKTDSSAHPQGAAKEYDYEATVKARRRAANRIAKRNRGRVESAGTSTNFLSDQDTIPLVEALVQTVLERPHGTVPSRNEGWLRNLLRASPDDVAGSERILALAAGYGPKFPGHFLRSSVTTTSNGGNTADFPAGYLPAVPSSFTTDERASAAFISARLAEVLAHLHALATPSPLALSSPSIRTRAKEIVYTRANWTRHSWYGPFKSDGSGRVDWRKVEALAIVASANVVDARAMGWGRPGASIPMPGGGARASSAHLPRGEQGDLGPAVPPRGWSATRPLSAGRVRADPEGRDWSGLTTHENAGSYMFLHYPTYLAFQSRQSALMLGDEDEAVGDCLPMVLELLPEGEWPREVEQPDLSIEAQNLAEEDDDEDDEDWHGGGTGGSSDSMGDSDDGDSEDQRAGEEEAEGGSMTYSIESLRSAGSSQSVRQGPAHYENDPALNISSSAAATATATHDPLLDASTPSAAARVAPSPSAAASSASSATDFLTYVPLHGGQSSPGQSPHPIGEVEHLVPPPHPHPQAAAPPSPANTNNLPSVRFRPPPGKEVPHPLYPTLAFRGVPGRLQYAGEGQPIPATRPRREGEDPYHHEARTFRGTVEYIPEDGVARVRFVVRYGGEDQWLLTGVQFGGPGSKSGFVGCWTSADHSPESPSGPFMFWPHVRPEAQE